KSRKLRHSRFFAKTRNRRRSPIRISSVALPKSPVDLTREDVSPHVFTRKPRLKPAEFSIVGANRLLQQYRHFADELDVRDHGSYWGSSGHALARVEWRD